MIVGLIGDLGTGKTTFVQKVGRALGITEPITSPTFVIQKIYELQNQPFKKLVHIDAYRLDSAEELAKLKWDELISDPGNLVMVEWADKVTEIMPEGTINLRFSYVHNKYTIELLS